MKWVTVLLGTVLVFFLCFEMLFTERVTSGSARCAVTVVVLDRDSGRPVTNAEVQFLGPLEENRREMLKSLDSVDWKEELRKLGIMGRADNAGTVVLDAKCYSESRKRLLGGEVGTFELHQSLEVSHPGYEHVRAPVASLLGKDRFPLSKKELAVKVWLIPKTSPH